MDRAHIVAEIRRCAEANGGVPVGRMRFQAETGIPESAWLGRYWARWGDALQEAGFSPNELQQAISEEDLLAALAVVVRELEHIPTEAEIRLRRLVDSTFPSHSTFARFGRKSDLVRRLADYCGTDAGLADVRLICDSYLATHVAPVAESDESAGTDASIIGAVYLVKSGRHYKIGRSNSAGRRTYELAIQLPERLELVHVIETDDPVGIERYWHSRFADKRANGEWFALSKADVAAFRRRKRFM